MRFLLTLLRDCGSPAISYRGPILEETHCYCSPPGHPWIRKCDKIPFEWRPPASDQDRIRRLTFKTLWHRGFFISAGDNFGGDFLVYQGSFLDDVLPQRYWVDCCDLDNTCTIA